MDFHAWSSMLGTMARPLTITLSTASMVSLACGRTLMGNLLAAAPIVSLRIHHDVFVLPDPLLVQVTAYVPCGDTLMSSRALTVIYRRDGALLFLQTELRRRSLIWSMWSLTSWWYIPRQSGKTLSSVRTKTRSLWSTRMNI